MYAPGPCLTSPGPSPSVAMFVAPEALANLSQFVAI